MNSICSTSDFTFREIIPIRHPHCAARRVYYVSLSQTLALLSRFKSKLSSAITADAPEEDVEDLEEDDDRGWSVSHVAFIPFVWRSFIIRVLAQPALLSGRPARRSLQLRSEERLHAMRLLGFRRSQIVIGRERRSNKFSTFSRCWLSSFPLSGSACVTAAHSVLQL